MNGEQILEQVQLLSGVHSHAYYDELNDAYETLCRRAGVWMLRRRDETSLAFEAGASVYALPVRRMRRFEELWVRDVTGSLDWHQVLPGDERDFEAERRRYTSEDSTEETGRPRRFRLSGEFQEELEVVPTADAAYPARLIYIGSPEPLSDKVEPVLPENYHRVLAKLAAVYVLRGKDDEASHVRAQVLMREYRDALLPLAFDTAPNRAGAVRTPKQHILRA